MRCKHAIKDFSRLVIGPEVIEETANSIVLHDLSDPVELPQEKCVRRMHLIVNSMHSDAVEALASMDVGPGPRHHREGRGCGPALLDGGQTVQPHTQGPQAL